MDKLRGFLTLAMVALVILLLLVAIQTVWVAKQGFELQRSMFCDWLEDRPQYVSEDPFGREQYEKYCNH